MSLRGELLAANAAWLEAGAPPDLPRPPARRLLVLTCMDARVDTFAALGLRTGDAHVVRNAGAIVTDDVRRSVQVSRGMGTEAAAVVGHTDCAYDFPHGVEQGVRDAVAELERLGFREVAGLVYDVRTGRLAPVE